MNDFAKIPKVELHLHIEGAAPPDLVRRLGEAQGVDLSGLFAPDGGYASSDFSTFLAAYEQMSQVFEDPATYRDLTEAVLKESAVNGVKYTEIFISPPSLNMQGGGWDEMRAAIEEGADAAEAAHGIVARLIPVVIRHHGPEEARKAAKAILNAPRGRMVGFGIAGEERIHHPADFADAFAEMAEAGFRLTAHAGEWGGPESVRAALDDLKVERLGHGVRAIEDPALVERLAAERITLEVCPGSNVALGVYPDTASHPIDRLRRAGVPVTVSTDDPPFFRTDMTREYENLAAAFGYGETEFTELARTAMAAAFCDDETKARVAPMLGLAPEGT